MRILGIDPGFERLGIAVLEKNTGDKKERVLFSECFKTSAKLPFPERLALLGSEIKSVIKKYKPDVLAIETLFLTTNQKTVMRVSEARGVVIYEAALLGIRIFEASPLQIKIATTGYGRSEKSQVMKMVKLLVDYDDKTRPNGRNHSVGRESDDELDAIAIAITGFAHSRR